MTNVEQHHSALHESDNRYHIYKDCPQGNNIKNRCRCNRAQLDQLCEWCAARHD